MVHETRHLFSYHKYWINKDAGERNPEFTQESGKLLDLKDRREERRIVGLQFFTKKIREFLPLSRFPIDRIRMHVILVPSSTAGTWNPGMCSLVDSICKINPNFVDCKKALRRHTTIEKLANGGNRHVSIHLNSISLEPRYHDFLKKKTILLLDDVTTTGNSLSACSSILMQHEAGEIFPLALGRTHE